MRHHYLIGIGAGNPDYVTMQAVNALNATDVVFLVDKGAAKADLIVMTSHRPAMRTYFLGSNAGHVVRYAKCSVLVVRH